MQINFVSEFLAIMDTVRKARLSACAGMLWVTLFYLANDRARITEQNAYEWPDDFFEVDNGELSLHCRMNKRTLLEARDQLKELGLIDYIPGSNRSDVPQYRIIYLTAGNGWRFAPVSAPVSAPVDAPVSAPIDSVGTKKQDININKIIKINKNEKKIKEEEPLAVDEDLLLVQEDHDAIFDLWKRCGWNLSEVFMDQLAELYGQYGLQKVLDAIRITAQASPGAPMLYLRKVLAGTGRPTEYQPAAPRKLNAYNFTQRDYYDDTSDMDRMMAEAGYC